MPRYGTRCYQTARLTRGYAVIRRGSRVRVRIDSRGTMDIDREDLVQLISSIRLIRLTFCRWLKIMLMGFILA